MPTWEKAQNCYRLTITDWQNGKRAQAPLWTKQITAEAKRDDPNQVLRKAQSSRYPVPNEEEAPQYPNDCRSKPTACQWEDCINFKIKDSSRGKNEN